MADEGLVPLHYSQTSPSHASIILEQLNVQRYYGAFCDIVLRVEDVDVRLHKCVLAASSARLQSMVYGMRQECGDLLTLKDVSLPGFWPILDYIYTGVLKLENSTIQEVLMASQLLEIRDVEKICLEYVRVIQNASSGSTTSGTVTTSSSPADSKVQSLRTDVNMNGVGQATVTTASNTDVLPPPLFAMSSVGVVSAQYLTPISPAQVTESRDARVAGSTLPVVLTAPSTPLPPAHVVNGAQNLSRTATPNQTPNATPGPPIEVSTAPPVLSAAPMVFSSMPMPTQAPHVPPQLPAMAPSSMAGVTTTHSPVPTQTATTYQMGHTPDQTFPPVHSNHGNSLPRGFPGMPIDTNYVEDYLKLIESFQGEPQQLVHQVQQFQHQQQQHHQHVPHHIAQQPPCTPHHATQQPPTTQHHATQQAPTTPHHATQQAPTTSHITHRSNHGNHKVPAATETSSAPATPQAPVIGHAEYINVVPQSYEAPGGIEPPTPAPKEAMKVSQTVTPMVPAATPVTCTGPLTPTTATRVRTYSNSASTNPIVNMSTEEVARVRTYSNSASTNSIGNMSAEEVARVRTYSNSASTNPIGNMSAEEVRRTVLNVLSKFDDDDEDEGRERRDMKQELVPPLTSFLNFTPLVPVKLPEPARPGPGSESEPPDLYGDLQIVSSDCDSDNDPGSDHAGVETEDYEEHEQNTDGYSDHTDHNQHQMAPYTESPHKDSLLMRMKKSATKSLMPNEMFENHVMSPDMDNSSNMVNVGNLEINLNLDTSLEDDTRMPDRKTCAKKKKIKKNNSLQRETDFKETVKDPNLSNRPLKKRIRLKLKKKFQCMKCGREFVRGDALESHIEQHNKCVLLSCHVCSQKFARVPEMTRHMRSHTVEIYSCEHCEAEFRDSKQYKQHVDSIHKEMRAFYCTFPECNYRSARLSNLEKHIPIHGDMKRYTCNRCGKCFAQPNGLRSHQKSCMQERGYLCDICGAKFNYLQSMKSHRLLHTGEKPFDCPECGAKFTDPRNLKRHRRIHTNQFPYKCPLCDKRFRHSNSLKAHTNTHDRKKLPPDFDLHLARKHKQLMLLSAEGQVNHKHDDSKPIDMKMADGLEDVNHHMKLENYPQPLPDSGHLNAPPVDGRHKLYTASPGANNHDSMAADQHRFDIQNNSLNTRHKQDYHQVHPHTPNVEHYPHTPHTPHPHTPHPHTPHTHTPHTHTPLTHTPHVDQHPHTPHPHIESHPHTPQTDQSSSRQKLEQHFDEGNRVSNESHVKPKIEYNMTPQSVGTNILSSDTRHKTIQHFDLSTM